MVGNKKLTEKDITKAIRDLLKTLGIWHWKQWQGSMSQPKGVSDILGCYQGRMVAIEVKRPGGKPTEDQQKFIDRVKREGGIAFCADSVEAVMEGLKLEGVRLF